MVCEIDEDADPDTLALSVYLDPCFCEIPISDSGSGSSNPPIGGEGGCCNGCRYGSPTTFSVYIDGFGAAAPSDPPDAWDFQIFNGQTWTLTGGACSWTYSHLLDDIPEGPNYGLLMQIELFAVNAGGPQDVEWQLRISLGTTGLEWIHFLYQISVADAGLDIFTCNQPVTFSTGDLLEIHNTLSGFPETIATPASMTVEPGPDAGNDLLYCACQCTDGDMPVEWHFTVTECTGDYAALNGSFILTPLAVGETRSGIPENNTCVWLTEETTGSGQPVWIMWTYEWLGTWYFLLAGNTDAASIQYQAIGGSCAGPIFEFEQRYLPHADEADVSITLIAS